MGIKLTTIQKTNLVYQFFCLIGMLIVCSCTTMQEVKSKYIQKTKLSEYYNCTVADSWISGTATNGNVSSKEFLNMLSSFSQPVKEVLSQYGYPDFLSLVKERPDNSDWSNLVVDTPCFKIAMLYCNSTNICVYISQKYGQILTEDYTKQLREISGLMDTQNCDERLLEIMRKDRHFWVQLRDKSAPSELVNICYQRKLEDVLKKKQEKIKQEEEAKVVAEKKDRLRRESLPPDKDIEKVLVGYWKYENQSLNDEYTIFEKSTIEYHSNNTFTVKGKLSILGKNTSIMYSGIWNVLEGRVTRDIKAVEDPGFIEIMTPLGYLPQECVKVGIKDVDSVQSLTTQRVEMVIGEKQRRPKILTRLDSIPLDAAKLDEHGFAALKVKADNFKKDTFVFKAFYLGMPIEVSAALVAYYMRNTYKSSANIAIEETAHIKWFIDKDSGFRVEANKDGRVTAIYMPKEAVDIMFDTKGVDVKSFIKTFQNSYSLNDFMYESPALEFFSHNSVVGKMDGIQPIASKLGVQDKWTTTSKLGYSITVFGSPAVLEESKLREFVLEGSVETIPSGSILVRKINTAAFD